MDLATLRAFFMWCTILNAAMLLLTTGIACTIGIEWVRRVHGRWFPMSREAFIVVYYSFLGAMKIILIFFNLVPWIALLIVG